MHGRPTSFWGKLEQDDAKMVVGWHPLEAHCADVAACAEALLRSGLLRRRLAVLGGRDDLDEIDVSRLCAIAALHDIGKFNLGFQRKGDAEPRDTAGHVQEPLQLLGGEHSVERDRLLDALPSHELNEWCREEGGLDLLVAAVGHHGRPVALGHGAPELSLWRATPRLDPIAGIAQLTSRARAWFPRAFVQRPGSLPSTPAFQHAFAGLVMLADWLGSDRHEELFPFADDGADRIAFARARAARAVERIGLDPTAARRSLGDVSPSFESVSPFSPRAAQSAVLSLPADSGGALTVLESETGSGKTEAALIRYVKLFHAGLVDGMTFALPTRTAATQLHARVVAAVARAFPDAETRPGVVLAVPGYLQVDDVTGRKLPAFEVLWNDDARERMRFRGWPAEQPKRYLAGAIVVGTIDQVLLSSLRVGHAHLRAASLLRHLLVVDEVHASDTYMARILIEVLRFHLAAGGHALLMSATLGTYVRERLEASLPGRAAGTASPSMSLEEACSLAYPIVHHAPVGDRSTRAPVHVTDAAKDVLFELESIADDPVAIAGRALAGARRGARVVVLRNTVADAIATHEALEELVEPEDRALLFHVGDVATLHHARFARLDRIALDHAIEGRYGKAAPAGGVVAISTQTIQQALDLDADWMLTDLAPMDVLLQRVGRVHRHRERDAVRPDGFSRARATILLGTEPLDAALRSSGEARGTHGVGSVYDNVLILEATRRELEDRQTLRIPDDNRVVVERTTHPEALGALATLLGQLWTKHHETVDGKYFAHRGIAELNLVQRDARFGEYSFESGIKDERIASRLGESSRRVRFEQPVRGPFGNPLRELDLPGWLVRDVPPDPNIVATNIASLEDRIGRFVRFDFGSLQFRYDRLGVRPAQSSKSVADADG